MLMSLSTGSVGLLLLGFLGLPPVSIFLQEGTPGLRVLMLKMVSARSESTLRAGEFAPGAMSRPFREFPWADFAVGSLECGHDFFPGVFVKFWAFDLEVEEVLPNQVLAVFDGLPLGGRLGRHVEVELVVGRFEDRSKYLRTENCQLSFVFQS